MRSFAGDTAPVRDLKSRHPRHGTTQIMEPVNAIDRDSAQHYVWGEVCDGWHLLQRPELSVIAERVPPGAREQRHRHQHACQFFYILSGRAVMELDGRRVELGADQGLEIPPQTPHQFRNESDADVHFLVISHPSTRGDRVEA